MKTNPLWIAAMLALSTSASGEIYRGQASGGTVTYQQLPCAAAAEGDRVAIASVYPDHRPERDRLDAREAAADARLLKRLEIESRERIAREERAAREAELAAERERTAREAQSAPVFIIGVPHRVRPYTRPRATSSSLR